MRLLPGVLLAGMSAWAAHALAGAVPSFQVGAVVWAVLIGFAGASFLSPGPRFSPGLLLAEKRLLEVSVVLLGTGLDISLLAGPAPAAMLGLVLVMGATAALGPWLARRLSLSGSTGFLLGIGSAICGSSAIAAVAPAVSKDRHETALSIGVVNIVGFAAMLVMPFLARSMNLSVEGAALAIGGSLPAVGHAVGAGYVLGERVGSLAIAIKMGRVMFLLPLVVGCHAFAVPKGDGPAPQASVIGAIPWFVPGFIAVVVLRNAGFFPEPVLGTVSALGHWSLAAAMAAIGFGVEMSSVRRHGPKVLFLGGLLIAFQCLAALFLGAVLA